MQSTMLGEHVGRAQAACVSVSNHRRSSTVALNFGTSHASLRAADVVAHRAARLEQQRRGHCPRALDSASRCRACSREAPTCADRRRAASFGTSTSTPASAPCTAAAAAAAAAIAVAALTGDAPALAVAGGTAVADACAQELGGTDLNTVIIVACVLEFVALTGAAVGGYLARVRKAEVEKINAQLRQINLSLRRQARLESYAPSLSYAPVGAKALAAAPLPPSSAAASAAVQPPVAPAAEPVPPVGTSAASSGAGDAPAGSPDETDAGRSPSKRRVLQLLREGKRGLREQQPARAFSAFQEALKLAREVGDATEEKKAARGLGASCQRQRKFREAIDFHQIVLQRSAESGEHSGDTEALGAIADCYTELGDLEAAAHFYDRYIALLESNEGES